MRKYKVLHLTNFLDMSGQQEDTLITATGLNQERFEVSLAANLAGGYGFDNVLAREARQISHLTLRDIPALRLYPLPWYDLLALVSLYKLMKAERYDIVHTHASKAGFLGRAAAKLAGVPIIVHSVHGWPFQWPVPPRRGPGARVAVPHPLKVAPALWNQIFLQIERFAARFTDKICTLTRTLAEDGISHRVGRPDQYAVTFSGINLDQFRDIQVDVEEQRASLGLPAEGPVVGTMAIMVRRKGIDDIVRAAPMVLEAVPDAHFLLVGDGEAMPEVRALVRELGLEKKVSLPGIRRDVPQVMAVMDVFAHMAWFEILPRTIIQALAAGTPVVVARAGSVHEIVADGENGYLVPPRDPHALAQSLIKLLRQPDLMHKIGQAARESVFKDFTFTAENMVRTTEAVYTELIETKLKDARTAHASTASVNL